MPSDSGDEVPGQIPHPATAAELRDVLAAERAPTPFLLYRGEGVLYVRALTRARLTLGRGAANDVALPWDEEVSRAHAEIQRVGGDWVLGDDGLSLNGTHVNGERLRGRRRLEDGDHVLLGRTAVVFRRAGAATEGSTVAGPTPATAAAVTPAQRRVLVALCRPLVSPGVVTAATNQEIAETLHLSVEAVKAHLRALFHSFGVGGLPQNAKRAALADRALRTGAVTPRELEYGYAGMELLGRRGRPLPTRVIRVHARRPTRVRLAPGARASALLYWASAARAGDRQRGPCQPRPAHVEVTPPDETTQLLLRWPDGPVCGQGRIFLLPFRAGTRGF